MAKSVIFVTTETSGSQSLWRIQSAIGKGVLKPVVPVAGDGKKPNLGDLEREDRLYMVRGVSEFAAPVFSTEFRYVVNVRDPRDILCNQYYWLIQHPINGAASPEQLELEKQRRQKLYEAGIDNFVRSSLRFKAYDYAFAIANEAAADAIFVSYNQLCCDYEGMVNRLVEFLGFGRTKHADSIIARESPAGIAANERWVGQNWVGCDTAPGRYRSELQPDTIAALNRAYEPILARLRYLEQPHLRGHYSVADAAAAPAV